MSSYTLDTGKKYIKDIFDKDAFYNIPEYQRPYVWGKDEISILLDDLAGAMESDSTKEYFLGCMIWNTKSKTEGRISYSYQDILDGQQRFITLYLLHGVLRDISDTKKLKAKVQERLRQEEDEFEEIPARNRVDFEIRSDHSFLEEYLLKEGATQRTESIASIAESPTSSTSVGNMAQAILVMNTWWAEKKKTVNDFQSYLNEFLKYISSNVLTLFLATPDNLDDAYNLFTVLNSRGLQLQISDILRAQNLRVIADDKQRKTLASNWSDFESNVNAPFRSFDDFLWALVFIKMKYRSDENKTLSVAFDFLYKRRQLERGVGTFEFVGKYVNHFDAIANRSITSEQTIEFFANINFLLTQVFGSQYMSPMMHYRERFGEYRIIEFLLKIDNLLSAAWLMGKRVSQSRIFIILRRIDELFKEVSEGASGKEAADRLIIDPVLKYDYDDESASTYLDIEELYKLFDIERWGSFSGTRINKTRYLLLKLDILVGNLNAKLQFNRLNSSVEHLMPRTIESSNWEIQEEHHKIWLHRLGNLVLIDRKKNASISNNLYSEKRDKYKNSIENRPNTNFVFINYREWNIDTIEENHIRVVNLLKKYYHGNSLETLHNLISEARALQLNY